MKFKFNTTRTSGEKSPLRIGITDKTLPGGRIFVATGMTIMLEFWDKKRQRMVETKKATKAGADGVTINSRLAEIEKLVKDFINDGENTITKATIANLINPEKPQAQKQSMIEWMRDDLDDRANLAATTRKSIKDSINILEDFINTKAPDLSFHNFSFSISEKLIKFMTEKRNKVIVDGKDVYRGLKPSSRGKAMKNIKVLLKRAHLNSTYKVNLDYPRFLVEKERADDPRIALNSAERKTIVEADLSNKRLDKVRDLFVLQMFTGLRVSDLMKLKKEDFNFEKGIIKKRTKKVSKFVSIPFFPAAKAVYKKYDGDFPFLSDQKYNKYIKELFGLLDLDRPFPISGMENGMEVHKDVPIHETISSHDARRTFVTAGLNEWGIPVADMAGMTGQTLKTIERYNKPDRDDVAAKYANMAIA